MSSDNVELLSYTTPLTSGKLYTSEMMILGQYISLSIVGKTEKTMTVTLEFSGDGKSWDYSVVKSAEMGVGFQESSPVLAKWTRIVIRDTASSNHSFTRVFVYGVPSNSSLRAVLEGVGDELPLIKLDKSSYMVTAFNELSVQSFETKKAYSFDDLIDGQLYDPSNLSPQFGGVFRGHNIDLCNASQGVTNDPTIYSADGMLHLRTNETTRSTEYHLCSNILNYVPGIGLEGRGTVLYRQPTVRTSNMFQLTGVYTLQGTFPNQTIYDGFFLGHRDPTVYAGNPLQLCYYRDGSLQNQIPQHVWNGDRCDGTGQLGTIDWSTLQLWRLSIGYLGAANATWQLMSNAGNWVTIHTYRFPNTLSSGCIFRSTGFRIGCMLRATAVASTSKDGEIVCGSWSLGMNGLSKSKKTTACSTALKSNVTSEVPIISIRNEPMWNLRTNTRVMELDAISVGVQSNANGTSVLRLYRQGTLVSPTWSLVNSHYLPISEDTSASAVTVTDAPILCIDLAKEDSKTLSLTETDHNARNEHFELQPGNIYTFTLESTANTEIRLSASYNLK